MKQTNKQIGHLGSYSASKAGKSPYDLYSICVVSDTTKTKQNKCYEVVHLYLHINVMNAFL
jgi:hypothetical protein